VVQLNRKLEVFTNQNERQTTEIANLRRDNSSLCAKLDEAIEVKRSLESELDTTRFQLVGMIIAKKKADQELAMRQEKGDTANLQTGANEHAGKIFDRPVEDCDDKENTKPKAAKRSLLKSKKVALARRHRKMPLALAAAKQV